MWTMARLTFREMVNKKVLYLGLALTVLYLGLYALGLHNVNQSMPSSVPELIRAGVGAQLLTAGLFVSGMMVAAITIFTSVGTIAAEIENGVMHAIAAKPLRRSDIYLGKYVGLGAVLVLYSLLVFSATSFLTYLLLDFQSQNYSTGLLLFSLEPLVLLAVTLWGSSLLSTLGNGIVSFLLYSVALIGGMVEQIGGQLGNASLATIGIVTSLIMPVDSMYRLVNFSLLYRSPVPAQIVQFNPFSTTTPASHWMIAYTVAYLLFFLLLGLRRFSKRDI